MSTMAFAPAYTMHGALRALLRANTASTGRIAAMLDSADEPIDGYLRPFREAVIPTADAAVAVRRVSGRA